MSYICPILNELSKHQNMFLELLNIKYIDMFKNNTDETKCLNTMIFVLIVILGKELKKDIFYCNTVDIQTKIDMKITNNIDISKTLKRDIQSNHKGHYIYCVFLSDGNWQKKNKEAKFFPGHVFCLEKYDNLLYIYQSYINKYTLQQNIRKTKCAPIAKRIIYDLLFHYGNACEHNLPWNLKNINIWKELTSVDTYEYLEYYPKNFNICYKRFPIKNVEKNVLDFLNMQKNTNKKFDRYINKIINNINKSKNGSSTVDSMS